MFNELSKHSELKKFHIQLSSAISSDTHEPAFTNLFQTLRHTLVESSLQIEVNDATSVDMQHLKQMDYAGLPKL